MKTLLITFVFVLLSLCLLGIGYLITGKKRLYIGMCGKTPSTKNPNDVKCGLCGRKNDEECQNEELLKRDSRDDSTAV